MTDRRSVFTKHEKKALADLALEYAPKFRSAGMPGCFRQSRNGETIEVLIGEASTISKPDNNDWDEVLK
ncbi:hypothetical protein [Ponticaulis koreensis]|uniref:hypothetical protein n=1 Tax=Ponticaulis koreensis TaxID=1123045 RepID=UPI0003B6D1B1|nr:hypothetical protein [Ponticaulis koreensis]